MISLLLLAVALSTAHAQECGVPAIAPHEGSNFKIDRVVGGREAIVGSWPWQVQMKYYNSHYCGGIVIDEDWVLTAAHCMTTTSTSAYSLSAGGHNKNSVDATEQTRRVSRIIKHSRYTSWNIDNDIALMKVSSPWEFNDYVSAACLPSSGEDLAEDDITYTTGYGSTSGTCCANKLKQAMVPHVTYSKCRQAYSSLTTNMICAGYYTTGGHDACQGDSGGPLVHKKSDNKWYVFGIVSWGNGCARPGYPGVYTKVSNYISWIGSNTRVQ